MLANSGQPACRSCRQQGQPRRVTLQGTLVWSDVTGVSANGPGSFVTLNGSTNEDVATAAIATNGGVIYSYGNNDLPSGTAVTSIPLQ